jgi:hypothetical protein
MGIAAPIANPTKRRSAPPPNDEARAAKKVSFDDQLYLPDLQVRFIKRAQEGRYPSKRPST